MNIFLSNFAAENAVLPLDVSIYRACKDLHGSKAAIAEINGFNPMVFSKCVDINNTQYHLHPEHIEAVLHYTKDKRILESLASAHGQVVFFEYRNDVDIKSFDFLSKVGKVSKKVGELFDGLSESLSDGKITSVEMAMLEKHAMELIASVAALKKLAKHKSEQDFQLEGE